MFLGILTLITALSISAVAIYYSVAGLVAIFAAAAIPIMIMGTTLEIAKLVTALWLHYYWNQTVWWLKTYLSISVIVLMFITSMGIFGFLSKAHIEQTSNVGENVAKIERIDLEIQRQQAVITRAEAELLKVETADSSNDAELQLQIDKEQERIDTAYLRIQPAIDEQNELIRKEDERLSVSTRFIEEQIASIDQGISAIDNYLTQGQIRELQTLVGVRADGNLGPATRTAIDAYKQNRLAEKTDLIQQLADAKSQQDTSAIDRAREEIQRLRQGAEQLIQDSNQLISRLRSQLGTEDKNKVEQAVAAEQEKIRQAETQIVALNEEKFNLEADYRKLEAEVGPIKYIAEFVYGDTTDKDLLEEAVRWVIITIIFVFDPLAVLLLIASQYTFDSVKRQKKNLRTIDETHTKFTNEHNTDSKESTIIKINISGTLATDDTVFRTRSQGRDLGSKKITLEITHNENIQPTIITTDDAGRVIVSKDANANTDAGHAQLESVEVQLDEAEQEKRRRHLEEIDLQEDVKISKQKWKEENPDQNIKFWKDQYIKGKIDELPWSGYVQNGEQNDGSLWNRIRSKDE
jgi:hypothetical protein